MHTIYILLYVYIGIIVIIENPMPIAKRTNLHYKFAPRKPSAKKVTLHGISLRREKEQKKGKRDNSQNNKTEI